MEWGNWVEGGWGHRVSGGVVPAHLLGCAFFTFHES